MVPVTIEELKRVIALREIPDEHLAWIINHSTYAEYEDGSQILKTGQPIDDMWMIIEGKADFYMNVSGNLTHYFIFENDENTGGMGGLLPYSRMKVSPGDSFAVGKVRVLMLHRKYFPDLEKLNPDLIQRLIGYMTERARTFATTKLQHEKVSALGKLAAGIAHELNNPAAAIHRISSELTLRLRNNYEHTQRLLFHNIKSEHLEKIKALKELKSKEKSPKLSALARIEREDEISDWLENYNLKESRKIAETFTESGYNLDDIGKLKSEVGDEALPDVLLWLENLLSSGKIIQDLEEASSRISKLVGAIKSHVHMDRTNDVQCTNIHTDLDNTLTLLGYKLREKNISVTKEYCDGLPEVEAYVGELNQVWTNIIDNAIFSLEKNGRIVIATTCDSRDVNVKIIDNGHGIPPDIINRIFDPFFTTKKVGQGTGIGLDLVQRVIKRHKGDIKVHSVPGRTEFHVCIPMKQKSKP